LREEDQSYKRFIDCFRPGYLAKVGKITQSKGQKYHFCSEKALNGKSISIHILDFSIEKFGKMTSPRDFYNKMKSFQDFNSNFEKANMSYMNLCSLLMSQPKLSTKKEFLDNLYEAMTDVFSSTNLVYNSEISEEGKTKNIDDNDDDDDQNSKRIAAPPVLINNLDDYQTTAAVNEQIRRDMYLKTIHQQQVQNCVNKNDTISIETVMEMIKIKRKELRTIAKRPNSAEKVLTLLNELKNLPPFNIWYESENKMKDARSDRSNAEFCRTTLKPILKCFEGKCHNGSQNKKTIEEFLSINKRRDDLSPKLVDVNKSQIYLSDWEKGCRCILLLKH